MTDFAVSAGVDRDEQAALWCLDMSEGELSGHEQARFDAWVSVAENATAFEDAARVWGGCEAASDMPELIQMRSAALESYRRANHSRWRRKHRPGLWLASIAAVLVVALITTVMLNVPSLTIRTGLSERRIALLEDGSRLSLDADTEIEVRLHRDRRELTLVRGRAKFDVAKDPLRPFTVAAGGKIVVATGTSFSVELLERTVRVLLYEGHVSVLEGNGASRRHQKVRSEPKALVADQALVPGSELVAAIGSSSPASIGAVDTARSLAWESGQLVFDDEPLALAVERMNRYSKDKIVVGDAYAARTRVTGVFTAGDAAAFVEGVTALHPIRSERQGNIVTLRQ